MMCWAATTYVGGCCALNEGETEGRRRVEPSAEGDPRVNPLLWEGQPSGQPSAEGWPEGQPSAQPSVSGAAYVRKAIGILGRCAPY